MNNDKVRPSESSGENVQYAPAVLGADRATRTQAKAWVRENLDQMSELLTEYADDEETLTLLMVSWAVLRYLDDLLIATNALEAMYD